MIQVSATRSSGPGGQNVNKVASCIELRFNPESSELFSDKILKRIYKLAGKRVDSNGNLIIRSQKYREQYRNLIDAYDRLKNLITKALKPPKPRKPTKPSKASREKRILEKKKTKNKKALRQKPIIIDE